MAGPRPGTQPRQAAPPAPLPPGTFHSDGSALCQSNRCTALCAGYPSGSCLEKKKKVSSQKQANTNQQAKSEGVIQVVPATALSRPSSSSHKCSDAWLYWSVNLGITREESSSGNKQLMIRSNVGDERTSRRSSSRAQRACKTHPGRRGQPR